MPFSHAKVLRPKDALLNTVVTEVGPSSGLETLTNLASDLDESSSTKPTTDLAGSSSTMSEKKELYTSFDPEKEARLKGSNTRVVIGQTMQYNDNPSSRPKSTTTVFSSKDGANMYRNGARSLLYTIESLHEKVMMAPAKIRSRRTKSQNEQTELLNARKVFIISVEPLSVIFREAFY